ncbi:LptF/LptG family permease [Campylobacter sp. US33a]|uniref:LptF/LptG family permease n=1 Tax=Campylobacter sp. US33a TaxID=2498120 RepID=UPI001068C56F|nr:LptF/LptG family permease [Campylobacter sp. US33a]TEY04641.1 LptF/LptG family permease [Campylobacter sp. US33a]
MSVFFRFISAIYLKSFFIIFFSLVLFFVGVDLLLNFKNLPDSANLDILYVIFLSFSAMSYILPVSLVFALIMSLISMIRSNELVSLYALGLSKNHVILYPFLWALFFCLVYVGLNSTPFAYAENYKGNILNNAVLANQSDNIFLKYNEQFIYISKLDPLQNKVMEMKIFDIKDLKLTQVSEISSAFFDRDHWVFDNVKEIYLPQDFNLSKEGLKLAEYDKTQALYGFKPRIIEGAASVNSNSIIDAIEGIRIFSQQGINTNALKTELYILIFAPFFAPFLMLIMYYFFPAIGRFFNLAFIGFVFLIVTLVVWGVLFLFLRLSENGVLIPELGIIFPVLCLSLAALFLFFKHR